MDLSFSSARERMLGLQYYNKGKRFYLEKKFEIALHSIQKALDYMPGDKRTLVMRARCYNRLGKYKEALADTDLVLSKTARHVYANYERGEALYMIGLFEDALVAFTRCQTLRPKNETYRFAINKAKDAIFNCLGATAGIKIVNEDENAFTSGTTRYVADIIENEEKLEGEPDLTKNMNIKSVDQQLLGNFYLDQQLFEHIINTRDNMACMKKGNCAKINKRSRQSLEYMDAYKKFLQMHFPFYARRHVKAPYKVRPMFTKFRQRYLAELERKKLEKEDEERLAEIRNVNRSVQDYIWNIDKAMKDNTLRVAYRWTTILQQILQFGDGKGLPSKPYHVAVLHNSIGNMYLNSKDYERAIHHFEIAVYLSRKYYLPTCAGQSLNNIGKVYAMSHQYDEAIKIWTNRLEYCRDNKENAYLHYEIARSHYELSRDSETRDHAIKGFQCASLCNSYEWKMKNCNLIAECDVLAGDIESALAKLTDMLEMSMHSEDAHMIAKLKMLIQEICLELRRTDETVDDEDDEDIGYSSPIVVDLTHVESKCSLESDDAAPSRDVKFACPPDEEEPDSEAA